ncbi:MAG: hypothetical protein ACXV2D_05065 [Halobacteriota archaeon]
MEIMSKVWSAVAALWAAVLVAIAYLVDFLEPVWILITLWAIPTILCGTFISWAICEKKGWT